MRARAGALAWAWAIACALTPAIAWAAPDVKPPPAVRFVYDRDAGAADCPDAATVLDTVRARLGFDPFHEPAEVEIRVSVARATDELRAAILLSRGGAAAGERHLVSRRADCSELASAMALAISIAIDPLSVSREPPPPPRPLIVQVVAPPAPPPPPPPTAPSPPLIVHGGLGTAGNVGGSLSPALGFFAEAGVGRASWSVALEGRADLPTSRHVSTGAVSLSTVAGTLSPCLRRGPFGGCALLTVAVLRGSGQDLDNPHQVSTPVVAVGARTLVELPREGALSFRVNLDLSSPLVRTTIRVSGEPVWTAPPVSVALGIGVVAKFR